MQIYNVFLNFMKKKQENNEYVQVQNAWKNCNRASYLQTPYFSQFLFFFEKLKTYGCADLNSIIPLWSIEAIKLCPRILSFLRGGVFRHRPTTLMLWILGEHTGLGECTITAIQTVCSCHVLPAVCVALWHIQKSMMAVRIFYVFLGVWNLSCFYKQLCLQWLWGHWYSNMV
jgi:hypothetical protein